MLFPIPHANDRLGGVLPVLQMCPFAPQKQVLVILPPIQEAVEEAVELAIQQAIEEEEEEGDSDIPVGYLIATDSDSDSDSEDELPSLDDFLQA